MNKRVKIVLWVFGLVLAISLILNGISTDEANQIVQGWLILCALFVMQFWGKKE